MDSSSSNDPDTVNSAGHSAMLIDTAHRLTPTQALPLIPPLDPTGLNLSVWERQLKLTIPQVTGLGVDYLDTPSSTAADPDSDRIVLSLIILSIAEPLRNMVNPSDTAREALRRLKNSFGPSSESHTLAAGHSTTRSHDAPNIDSEPTECSSIFYRVPVEILEQIVPYVNTLITSETRNIQYTTQAQEVLRHLSTGDQYYVYEAAGVPRFNSLQSLACVNRELYGLCYKQLWKHLKFPSSAPGPISRWTDGILLKHGHLVESVSIKVNPDWWKPSRSPPDPLDNLKTRNPQDTDASRRYHQGLSYENCDKIIKMCPNVRSMDFMWLDHHMNVHINGEELYSLYHRLRAVILHVPALTHLVLSPTFNTTASDQLVTSIIENLPMLESLTCANLFRSPFEQPTGTFGRHLTHLKHLSKLSLQSCDAVDETWCSEPWPKTITHLFLFDCRNLSIRGAQRLIPCMAPNLVDLELLVRPDDQQEPIDHALVGQYQFKFPALRSLKLWNASTELSLLNFQQCKNLRLATSWEMPSHVWKPVPRLICASTWPKLYFLDVQSAKIDDDTDGDVHTDLLRLRSFCDETDIKLLCDEDDS